MTGHTIAIANMKGGVGKTTMVVSLAETFAAEGKRVLVMDLDAQASVSFFVAGNDLLAELIQTETTTKDYFEQVILERSERRLKSFVRPQASRTTHAGDRLDIALLASSPFLRQLEREIVFEMAQKKYSMHAIEGQATTVLKRDLDQARETYDYILIDCAPGISAFTEVAIRLSDLVIVPTIPDLISTIGLEAFCTSLWHGPAARRSSLPAPQRLPHVLATRVQTTKVCQDNVALMRQKADRDAPSFRMFATEIPQRTDFPRALATIDALDAEETIAYRQKWGHSLVVLLDAFAEDVKGVLDGTEA